MKSFIKFLVCASLMMCFTTAFSSDGKIVPKSCNWNGKTQLTLPDTFYCEDFESGAPGWISVDLTDVPGIWHPDTFQAYGSSGMSWWMGNPITGGYLDHWYQVLDSPEIILPAGTCSLKFVMNRAVEKLGGDAPYNGWDGINVRISTNGGSSWTVLTNPIPAYNSTSMYSFGSEHGEGPDIPGWGGKSGGWVDVAFDISGYAGKTVNIRWAFASDPAFCTGDDATLFGVQIDDIDVAGVFTNNGEDATGFTRKSIVPIGGDLWHIMVDSFAPSPNHAACCGLAGSGNTYNPNMENAYISPLISLPLADTIIVGFWLRGWVEDPDTFPFCDYFGAQLSPDTGKTWYYFSNPTGDPISQNFIYTFPGGGSPWGPFDVAYGDTVDISSYAGKDLMFQIWFHSDADTPTGEGLYIDNFSLYTKESGVEEEHGDALSFRLWENSPNPMINKTHIRFSLPKSSDVSLRIYDVTGQLVRTLVNEPMSAGVNSVMWDARNSDGKLMPGGIYFYELKVGELKKTNKLILLK